jgi:hypothetical protein
MYIYIIANSFPVSTVIKDSPPFEVELLTQKGEAAPEISRHSVNQWGGATFKVALQG